MTLRRLIKTNSTPGTPIHPAWLCRSSVTYSPVRALLASRQAGASASQINDSILNCLLSWDWLVGRALVVFFALVIAVAAARSARALPPTQSAADTDGDATVTLWVKDRAIDGDERTWCEVRVEVLGVDHGLTTGDEVTVAVFEDDLMWNDLIFETTITVTAAEAAAGLVDHTLDCSGSFFTGDLGLGVEIFAEASVSKDTCGVLCFDDYPVTANLTVTVVDDDLFEEDDDYPDAVALATGTFTDRICRDADWWSFEVTEPSQVTVGLGFDPGVGALSAVVVDATGLAEVAASTPTAGGADLDAVLPAGRYYLRVTHDTGDDFNFYDYSVSISSAGCTPGATQDRDCGDCGLETRTCGGDGTWGVFGPCTGEGDCSPGDVEGRPCDGGAEQRTCEATCVWSAYGPCEGGCASGETEPCYGGPADTQDVGLCTGGTRTCTDGVWGDCEGAVLPSYELCSDGQDNDCDGAIDAADTNCSTAIPPDKGCACGAGGPGGPTDGGPVPVLLLLVVVGLMRARHQERQ